MRTELKTKPRILRRVRIVSLAVLLISLLGYGGYTVHDLLRENPPGYCVVQQRYIPDEEFIRTAIALHEWDMNRDYKVYPNGKISKKKDSDTHKDRYQKWEHSRSRPDCCQVFRADTKSAFRRMVGWQEVEVVLYIDQESRGDSQLPFLFDVCGKLLLHEFGFELETGYGEITTTNYQTLTNTK